MKADRARPQSAPLSGETSRYWISLLSIAAALRLAVAFGLLGQMPLVGDALSYSIEATKLLTEFPGSAPSFWPPGMPLLLTAVYGVAGDSLVVAKLTAVMISLVAVALCAALGSVATRSPRAGRLTGWIAALYPPDILMAGQTYVQPLTQVCLLAMAYGLVIGHRRADWRLFALAGVALGWGILSRPSTLSVGAAVVALWLVVALWRRRAVAVHPWPSPHVMAIFLLAAAVWVAPVMYHNARLGAGWTLSTNNEWNFLLGNNPYTPNYKTSHFGQRPLAELDPDARTYVQGLLERPDARQAMMQEALRYIREHPWNTAWRTLNRIRAFWGFDHTMARQIQHHFGWPTWAVVPLLIPEAGGYCLVALLALVGLICARDQLHPTTTILLLVIVLAYQAPYGLAFASSIYHVSVMGLLLPFAGAALASTSSPDLVPWPGREHRRRVALVSALFFAIQLEYGYHLIATM
jgi:4-amino-4-deoxy-L-arabinose transferase-like glycosyltransferase